MKKVNKPTTKPKEKDKNGEAYIETATLLIFCAYLFIDFIKYNERMEIIKPQFLYLNVLNILVGGFIFYNRTYYTANIISVLKKSYVFWGFLGFVLLSGFSILFAKNVSLGINSIAEILVIFNVMLTFCALLINRLHLLYKIAFLVGVSAFVQGFQAFFDFKRVVGDQPFLHSLHLIDTIKSNTGNMNIFAASLVYKVPFILLGVTYFSGWKKFFLAVALLTATTIIFLINARASLLSLLALLIIYIIYLLSKSAVKQSFGKIAFAVVPILIAFISVNIIFANSTNTNARFSSTLQRMGQISTNESSANLRLGYWANAAGLVKANPAVGVGLGNWRVESIPYESANLPHEVISLHAHNDFFELAAETGVLNGLIYFSIFVFLLYINLRRVFKVQGETKLIALLALMLLIVYGIDALFNFPFYRPTMQICFAFLFAFSVINVESVQTVSDNKNKLLLLLVLAIVPFYATYHSDKTSNLEYKIKTDNIDFNTKGKLTGDEVAKQGPLIPNVFNTSESIAEYNAIYYLREKNYAKAKAYFNEGAKVNPYLGRGDFYRYLMALEEQKPDSAYFFVKQSFYKRPINTNFLKAAIHIAIGRKDSGEILKMYEKANALKPDPEKWVLAANGLNFSNFDKSRLDSFLNDGIKRFAADSAVNATYTNTMMTPLIVKGQNLFSQGNRAGALAAYMEGYKLDPTNIYINQNIAFYYFNIGDPKKAISYFLAALKKPGLNNGKTEYYLSLCYFSVNDKQNGCEYLTIAKSMQYADAINSKADCK